MRALMIASILAVIGAGAANGRERGAPRPQAQPEPVAAAAPAPVSAPAGEEPLVKKVACGACSDAGKVPSVQDGARTYSVSPHVYLKESLPEADKVNRQCCPRCHGSGFRLILPSGEQESAATAAQRELFKARFEQAVCAARVGSAEENLKRVKGNLAEAEAKVKDLEKKQAEASKPDAKVNTPEF